MKRTLLLLLALLCALLPATPAFAADSEAYTLYTEAMKQLEDFTSVEMSGNMKVAMTVDGLTTNMDIAFTMTQVVQEDGGIGMEMNMTYLDTEGQLGTDLEMTCYYLDNYFYMDILGTKSKVKLPLDKLMAVTSEAETKAELDLSKLLADVPVEEITNGKRLRFTIKGDDMNALVGGVIGPLSQTLDIEAPNAEIGDIDCSYLFYNSGRIYSCRLQYGVKMEVEGKPVSAQYDMRIKYESINTVKKIVFPIDLKDYVIAA